MPQNAKESGGGSPIHSDFEQEPVGMFGFRRRNLRGPRARGVRRRVRFSRVTRLP
jgi:hypothetical protein